MDEFDTTIRETEGAYAKVNVFFARVFRCLHAPVFVGADSGVLPDAVELYEA